MSDNIKRLANVWWLADGQRTRSRQPSFAPASARPSVTASYFKLGWDRDDACFVTLSKHDLLAPAQIRTHPCDRSIALGILWHCSRQSIVRRFFGYCSGSAAEVFVAGGYLFGISVRESERMSEVQTSLHFYSPTGALQSVYLHDGMTTSLATQLRGMTAAKIYERLRQ